MKGEGWADANTLWERLIAQRVFALQISFWTFIGSVVLGIGSIWVPALRITSVVLGMLSGQMLQAAMFLTVIRDKQARIDMLKLSKGQEPD